jgi:methylenetetrahydrofolate reductase (NADPH)
LSDIYAQNERVVSFELYPPKTPQGEATLFETEVPKLLALSPTFMTCTYGAGGSTRDKTLEVVTRLKDEHGVTTAAHLTCVGSSREEIIAYIERIRAAGICNIVALRGDPPRGETSFTPHPEGLTYATELVRLIKEIGGFSVAVAGYPEAHPECRDKMLDWLRCRDKVVAGADVIITQLFYDLRDFYEFREHMTKVLKVNVPIVPGVLPIMNTGQIKRFCAMCGSRLPSDVLTHLDRYADDHESARRYGVELASRMVEDLLANDAPGIHFYVLNKAQSIEEILSNLGLAGLNQPAPAGAD